MKNKKFNKSSKISTSDMIITFIYIFTISGLFLYVYKHGARHNLSVTISTIFILIVGLYNADRYITNNFLDRHLSKFLLIVKRFLASPIFIIAFGSIIIFLFIARILHFSDLI